MIRPVLAATVVSLLSGAGVGSYQISESRFGAYEVSLAASGDRGAVAWYDTRHGHAEIYLRLLDSDGKPSGPERRITHGIDDAYEPDIAAIGRDFAVAWYEKTPATGRLRAKLGVLSGEGRLRWSQTVSAPDRDGRNPVVRVVGGQMACAWLEGAPGADPDVWIGWFDPRGRSLQPARRLAPAGRTTWNLNAATDDADQLWLVFDAAAGTRADELFLAQVDRTAARVTRLSEDDGRASKYPDLAFRGSRVALTWFDERDGNEEVYLFTGSMAQLHADAPTGVERRARRVTKTPGESIGAYVAWNKSTIGLAWCDNSGGQHEILFQRFNADGKALRDAQQLTHNPSESLIPAIRPWRDGFALAWNEFTPGRSGAHGHDGRSEVVALHLPKH